MLTLKLKLRKNFYQNKLHLFKIFIIFIIVAVALYLRFDKFKKRELWGDELHQIRKIKISLSYAISDGRIILHFPGDCLLIYPFYKLFGENKWGLAIPHIIITFLGFFILYILCKKYFKTIWGYVITFLIVTFNINLIFHAFEIRPYAVLPTLSITSFLVIGYIFEKENLSLSRKIFISIFIFVTLLFHLYGILILFFSYLFHLLFSRRKTIKEVLLKHLKYYGIVIVISLPIWFYFVSVDKSYLGKLGGLEDTFQFIPKGMISILKGVFGNLIGFKKFYFLLSGMVIALLIPHKERLKQIMFFIVMVTVPITLICLSDYIYKYWFLPRQFVWVMPLFAFLVGWCWDSVITYISDKFIK